MHARPLIPWLFLLSASARADVLHVPGEFPTIAFAVEAAGEGDTILIAAGTYDEQVVVVGADGLSIRGQGKVELTGTPADIGLILDSCVNTTVEKLRFSGQSLGLRVDGCTDVTVRKCRAEDMDELGFQVLDSRGTVFDRCVADGVVDQGLDLVGALGGTVRRCTFRNVGTGLLSFSSRAVEVDRLRVEHAADFGLVIDTDSTGVDVHHARIIDAGVAGISVEGDDNRLRHDVVVDAGGIGIQCTASAERNLLDRERVVASGGSAFVLGGEAQEARRCRAVKAGDVGFLCADTGRHLVQDCRATSSASYGIIVNGGCTRCTILDNVVTQAPENGIETDGDQTVLDGNVATGSGINGLLIGADLCAVTGNRAHGSGEFDLIEGSSVGSTYLDNHVTSVQLPGAALAETLHVPGDFTTIQAAVDAAQPGDLVLVAAGSYEETVTASLKQDVTLRGQGKVVLHGGDAGTAVLSLVTCTRFAVEHLRFEQPASVAVEVDEGDGVRLSDCVVEDSAGDGITVGDSLATILEGCTVLQPAAAGVRLVNASGTLVSGCRVEASGEACIAVEGGDTARVVRCRLIGPQTHGLTVVDSLDLAALGNVIEDAFLGGIDVDATFAVVRDNRMLRPGDVSVLVQAGAFGAIIEDNRFAELAETGLIVVGDGAVVRRNRVTKSEGVGIVVDGDETAVTDNVIAQTGDGGMLLFASITSGLVARNRVQKAGGSGFKVLGSSLLVHDNVSQGAGLDGFEVLAGPSEFVGNVAKGSALFDLDDTSGAGNVYSGNTFPSIAP